MSTTKTGRKSAAKSTSKTDNGVTRAPAEPRVWMFAGNLRGALRRIAKFASTDDTLPTINAVHIEVTAGVLRLTATDRFKLAVETIDHNLGDQVVPFTALVTLTDVRTIIARLSSMRAGVTVEIRAIGDYAYADDEGYTETGMSRITIADIPCGMGKPFPDYRKIFAEALADIGADEAGDHAWINPEHLRPFIGLGLRDLTLRVGASPAKPLIATAYGFVALIMPKRFDGDLASAIRRVIGTETSAS